MVPVALSFAVQDAGPRTGALGLVTPSINRLQGSPGTRSGRDPVSYEKCSRVPRTALWVTLGKCDLSGASCSLAVLVSAPR
jgi:hypothetical protein